MTVAAQKQVVEKALALPKKVRERLVKQLIESLDTPEQKLSKKEWSRLWKNELNKRVEELESGKGKAISGTQVMAEMRAKYLKSVPEANNPPSQEEWDEAWEEELEKRIEEMESGKDPGVPLEVIWEDLRKLNKKK